MEAFDHDGVPHVERGQTFSDGARAATWCVDEDFVEFLVFELLSAHLCDDGVANAESLEVDAEGAESISFDVVRDDDACVVHECGDF